MGSSRYLSGQFTLPVFKSKTKLLVKMKYFLMTSAVVLSFLYVGAEASPKLPGNKREARGYDYDYYNPYATMFQKRGSLCLPFGMSCSVKGISCCGNNVECRCNLFNTNCKCQRASLFGRR